MRFFKSLLFAIPLIGAVIAAPTKDVEVDAVVARSSDLVARHYTYTSVCLDVKTQLDACEIPDKKWSHKACTAHINKVVKILTVATSQLKECGENGKPNLEELKPILAAIIFRIDCIVQGICTDVTKLILLFSIFFKLDFCLCGFLKLWESVCGGIMLATCLQLKASGQFLTCFLGSTINYLNVFVPKCFGIWT